jgi:hypothetical protein
MKPELSSASNVTCPGVDAWVGAGTGAATAVGVYATSSK